MASTPRKPIPLSAAIGSTAGYAAAAGIVSAFVIAPRMAGYMAAFLFTFVIMLGAAYKVMAQILTPLGDHPPPLANCILLALVASLAAILVRQGFHLAGFPRWTGSALLLALTAVLARPFLRLSAGRCVGVAIVGGVIGGVAALGFLRLIGYVPLEPR